MSNNWVNINQRKARTAKAVRAFLLLALCLFLAPTRIVRAQIPPRKTVVVFVSGLSWHEVHSNASLAPVRTLAQNGAVALLNCAVSGEPTDAAAFLSVGASERMAAPGERSPKINGNDAARTIADFSTEAYATANNVAATPIYRRRMGKNIPSDAAGFHLGIPVLLGAQPAPSRAAQIGALGDTLESAGKRLAVWGDFRAFLVGMDANGIVRRGKINTALPPEQIRDALQTSDVLLVSVSDSNRLLSLVPALSGIAQSRQADVLLVSPAPPRTPDQAHWRSLGFVVATGPSFPAGSLLVSPTTRTPGLVANVDIAPTLAALQNAGAIPGAGGRVMTTVPRPNAIEVITRLDQQVTVTNDATVPIMVGYGTWAIVSGLCAVFAVATKRPFLAQAARFGLLVASCALLALLLQSATVPRNVGECALIFVTLSLLLALAAQGAGRQFGTSPLGFVFTATALTVAIDAVFGSPLVSRSILSGYYLAGIRFYGIGNEYMGVLVGTALLGPALLAPVHSRRWLVALLYGFALLALANPEWGADAGGALAATVAFAIALIRPRVDRLRLRHVGGAFILAFVVVGVIAFGDRLLPRSEQSHIGTAIATGQSHGLSALVEIAVRKIAMNVRLSFSPYTIAAVAALIPLWLTLARGYIGKRTKNALEKRPALAFVVPAALWGAFAAFAFNDSGVVAALLLLAPLTVAVIDSTVCDSSA